MKIAAALLAIFLANSLGAITLKEALQPLAAGVPEVAVTRLQQLLSQPLPAEEATVAKTKLAEAFVQSNEPEKALEVLQDATLTKNPRALFWHAQALAALGRWSEAQPAYQQVATEGKEPLRSDAVFGETQSLRALGRREEALRLLEQLRHDPRWQIRASLGAAGLLIDRGDLRRADHILREIKPERIGDRNERRFLFGRIHFAQGAYPRAIEIWSVILQKPEGVPHPLLIATLLAIADAHLQAKTPTEGDDVLEDFIDHHPADAALPTVFAKLDTVYAAEDKPSPNELERWTRDRAQPRRALAQWYLARTQLRAGERDTAIATLIQLQESAVQLPSLGEADFELARLLFADGKWDEAIAAAETAERQNPAPNFVARVDWLIATANYRAGRLEQAATAFEKLAQGSAGGDALFNAALCRLRLEQADKFASDYQQISNEPEGQQVQGELLLEEGMVQAAQGKPEAATSLEKFIRDFPSSPRISEAWVALAELAYHASKPDLQTAEQDLARARAAHPTPAAIERADYLQIWLEAATAAPNESKTIAAANRFLQMHPGSSFTAEVRMKLAEAYFRRQDFANAETQFELVAQQNPSAPLAEKALFFAGRSAMSSMGAESLDHALALFDQVGKLNGSLKWAARNEQAAIERRLGKNSDALAIYDEVLKNPAKPGDRREALCGKGDVLYEMGASDPQNYRRAIEFYDQLANEPGVPAHWRNQAEFKKGKALEKLNDKPAALTTYYNVIEQGEQPAQQHEFFWFYKSGFNAAHLLEETSDWKSAAAIYRRLASVGGARSDEARARLSQLRLEHFLWED
ncbi:MAG TPA: tetratricopeptide repeat protein [Chthoniobacterales bacterium]|nr:tetratricopeptide repeat protein [Chthoniobacterales bacterium]